MVAFPDTIHKKDREEGMYWEYYTHVLPKLIYRIFQEIIMTTSYRPLVVLSDTGHALQHYCCAIVKLNYFLSHDLIKIITPPHD